MNPPTLTVIMPNFNHGQYLPAALNGLVESTWRPDEIIVIDDGSTDNSWEIIQGFAARHPCIRAYRNERNMGAHFTADRALGFAQGDYVLGAAADDCVLPGFVEKSMSLIAKYPHAGLCCTIGDWREVATGLNWHMGVGMADTPSYLSPQKMLELERKGRLYIASNSVIVKRSALLEAGKFLPELKSACDWFAYYVIGFRHGICFVPEPLAVAQILPNSLYQKNRRDPLGYREMLEKILCLLNQPKYQDAAELIRQGGSLYIHGRPMLSVLLSRPENRRFITATFLRKYLRRLSILALKQATPAPLGNLYFRIAGYRAPAN